MTAAPQSRWRAILFYRITELDRQLLAWLFTYNRDRISESDRRLFAWLVTYNRKYAGLAKGFDSAWLRWFVTVCALLMLCNIAYENTVCRQAGALANIGFGFFLCLYFCHLLFRRLQCSLLEFSVMIIVLGNLEGLLLSTPGILSFGWQWVPCLALFAAAWVFHGAVNGLVTARVLGVARPLPRLALLLGSWLAAPAPALLLLGAFLLLFGRDCNLWDAHSLNWRRTFISPQMASRGVVLLALGVGGALVHIWLGRRIRRVSKEIFNKANFGL